MRALIANKLTLPDAVAVKEKEEEGNVYEFRSRYLDGN